MEQPAPRIVSLLPSATEIICALGASDKLVGISHECDFPETIRDRPVLTRTRVNSQASSREIDEAVRAVVRSSLSLYSVDEEQLAGLKPDVIVTQDLCEVCAVSLNDVRAAVAKLIHRERVHIVCLRPTRLEHVLGDIERVAVAIGAEAQGRALRAVLTDRIRAIAARASQVTPKPRVISIEWLDPLMLGGTWMPELIELAGGCAVGTTAGQPAVTVDSRTLAELRPDVIIVKPCGFSLERTLAEAGILERLLDHVGGTSTRVYVTDGHAFFNRPGPRLVESLEILAACLHPLRFADLAAAHNAVIRRLR